MLDQNWGFNLTHFNSVASLLATVHGVHRLGAWEKDDLQRPPSSHSVCISVDDCVAWCFNEHAAQWRLGSLLSHIHMQAFPVPLPLQVQGTSAELPHLSSFQFSWQVTGGFPLYCWFRRLLVGIAFICALGKGHGISYQPKTQFSGCMAIFL